MQSLALPIYDERDGSDATGWHQWLGTKDEFLAKYPNASYERVVNTQKAWRKYQHETPYAFEKRTNKMANEVRRDKILRCTTATDDQRRQWLIDDLELSKSDFQRLFPVFRQPLWPNRKPLPDETIEAQQARIAAETAEIVARRKRYLDPNYFAQMLTNKSEYVQQRRSNDAHLWAFPDPKMVAKVYPIKDWKRLHGSGYFVNERRLPTESDDDYKTRVENEKKDVVAMKRQYIAQWKREHPDAAEVEATGDDIYVWEKARYLELGGQLKSTIVATTAIGDKRPRDD